MEKTKLTKEQRDFVVEKKKITIMNYIQDFKYLVIDIDQNTKLYKSLRDIEKELKISYSGISKKLKMSNYCICVPKKSTDVYYIQNINSEV
tara:strand:+ start:363 stop:635 length:273 start_codon:yes stop_codon:yes gene_type:complete